jgi:hypothetical protein
MALTANTIPTLVGQAILEALRKGLVYSRLFNRDYQGDVTYGDSVKIPGIGSVSVSDYTRYTDLTWNPVSDESQTLPIDQAKSFSIVIDDLDEVQSKPDVWAAYGREARYQLQDVIDQYLASVLAAGGTLTSDLGNDTTPLEINSANIGEKLLLIARKLDEAKVPRERRVAVLPPWAIEDLTLANILESTDNTSELENGEVGRYAGFDILMSNNVPNSSGTAYKIVAGSDISATLAMQIEKVETIRLESYFGDGLRGLSVYGSKVTRPDTIAVMTANEAAET